MKSEIPNPTCGSCKYYILHRGSSECRRFPPQVTVLLIPVQRGMALPGANGPSLQPSPVAAFPPVGPDEHWCGEWASRLLLQ